MRMTRWLNALFFLLVWVGPPAQAAGAEPLRVLVSSAWSMPLLELRDEQVRGGIVPDMARAIAHTLSMPVSFVLMPRARMDASALAGEADLRCYVRTAWSSTPDAYQWSGELFRVGNVLVGHSAQPQPAALESLPPKTLIGAARGFMYPVLEPGFQSGRWRREDAIDIEKLLLKLALDRHSYAVVDELSLDWFLRQTTQPSIAPWRLGLSQESIQCAVPKAGRVAPEKLLPAIERLKSSGEMQRILQRYR
jgi:polar amino acid transport system substrate-binding protein